MSVLLQRGIVGMNFSQTEALENEVYHIGRLDQSREKEGMDHLKCVIFVRPTEENVRLICRELREPVFAEYHICKPLLPRLPAVTLRLCSLFQHRTARF